MTEQPSGNYYDEFDAILRRMEEAGRTILIKGTAYPLAVMAMSYLARREKIEANSAARDKLFGILAEKIEIHFGIKHRAIGVLCESMGRISQGMLTEWLDCLIYFEKLPISKFSDWFESKVALVNVESRHETPTSIAQLAVDILRINRNSRIFDPFCGTGAFLSAAAKTFPSVELFGQDFSEEACAWAYLRLLVSGPPRVRLCVVGGLADAIYLKDKALPPFDAVLCNPPFGAVIEREDKIGRLGHLQFSGRLLSETAFVDRIVSALGNGGQAAIIVPNGFLSRSGADQMVRHNLIDIDCIEAIISLPERLFAPTTNIETALLFVNKRKNLERAKKILFVDASLLAAKTRAGVSIPGDAAKIIVAIVRGELEGGDISRLVDISDIPPDGWNLQPSRYLSSTETARPDPEAVRGKIERLEEEYLEACLAYEMARKNLLDL